MSNWMAANQAYLNASLAILRETLEQALQSQTDPTMLSATPSAMPSVQAQQQLQAAATALTSPSGLEQITTHFGLSSFEVNILLLCAAIEIDSSFAALCANLNNDPQQAYPTFSLALRTFPQAHWNALTPEAPLRYWRLLDVGTSRTLTLSPLRIDERILHHLAGLQYLDGRLADLIQPCSGSTELVPSHQAICDRFTAVWMNRISAAQRPVIQLCGEEIPGKRAIAHAACARLGLNLYLLPAYAVPSNFQELTELMRLWQRESQLSKAALLLDWDDIASATDHQRDITITHLVECLDSPLIISTRDRRSPRQRSLITFDIHAPNRHEQQVLWRSALGTAATEMNGQVDAIVSQFNLSAPIIQAVCTEAIGQFQKQDAIQPPNYPLDKASSQPSQNPNAKAQNALPEILWSTCRIQARPRLDELAQRIESGSDWDDLVLPDQQKQVLGDVASHVRQRMKVYEDWGFAGKGGKGLGISALFAGASGTGKTMAADVLAQELNLDLYRIDLSQVVSKYIGETEKNLRRVFDAAEVGGVILLFDEADALFGKRSEVKDSHDRYANMEVSYLLQRMESYRGLAVLTTNLKEAIDTAFLRRLRFVVKFPFPDASQREEIWRRVFPQSTPTQGLDMEKLARLNVAGGNIRNIALNAAFVAAEAREAVGMKHVLYAARSEYMKLERTLTDSEVKGWL